MLQRCSTRLTSLSSSLGFCPEDNFDVKGVNCRPDPTSCDEDDAIGTTTAATTTISTTPSTGAQTLRMRASPLRASTTSPSSKSVPAASSVPSSSTHAPTSSPAEASNSSEAWTPSRRCQALDGTCPKGSVIFKAHGPLTGFCVKSDR